MKNYFLKVLFALSFGLLLSCSEDVEVLTSGQLIGKELQEIIKQNNVVRIEHRTVDDIAQTASNGTSDYEINNESIRLYDTWYNLNYLAYYEVQTFQEDFDPLYKLVLYFEY